MVSKVMRRVLVATLGLALAAFAVFGVSACANVDEQAVRSTVSKELDALKNPTQESLSVFIDKNDPSIEETRKQGVDPYEFLQHCFKGFDYEIRSVKVNDKSAIAEVHVKTKDLAKASEYARQQMSDSANASALISLVLAQDQSGLVKKYLELLYAGIDATNETVEKDVTLDLSKADDGAWSVTDESAKNFLKQMIGDINLDQQGTTS